MTEIPDTPTPDQKPIISIIIVHYNDEAITKDCLDTLQDLRHDGFTYRVIVVDNASRQPLSLPKRYDQDVFQVVRSESNLGFTGGNNLGIWYTREYHRPDYICLLNNDTTADPNFLQKLYDYLQTHVEVGMVSPKIYFSKGREFHDSYQPKESGRVIWYAGGIMDWAHLDAFHRGVDEVDRGQFDLAEPTDFATGCCVILPVSVIDRIGTLDKRYFLYFEDTDWSLQAKAAGFQIAYVPESVIWHVNAGSTGGSGSKTHRYYQTRNRLLLAFKFGGWRVRLRAAKFALNQFLTGDGYTKRAVLDFALRRFGKQQVH